MGFGLFGKLPQKRDFLSVNMPQAVLHPFETWLQAAVSASRSEIGRPWEDYYRVAPIWRFWLGKDVLGTGIAGSLVASVDQVGRYFPLAIIYVAEPGEMLTPPLLNPVDEWHRLIEERLLWVLSAADNADVSHLLTGLLPPDYSQPLRPTYVAPPPAETPTEPAPAAEGAAAPPTADAALWEPEPMPAESLAELQKIAPSSFAPLSPSSIWDLVDETPPPVVTADAAPAETALAPAETAVPAVAVEAETPTEPEPAVEMVAATEPVAAEAAASSAAPEPHEPPPPPPPAVAMPRMGPPVASAEFKGGILAEVGGGAGFVDALPELIAIDYAVAAQGRGYWWCAANAAGGPRLHAKQGLPDPYFFSRMLLWAGN